MAMKKTSGGDFPLWKGAGKSFWTLPILGRRRRRIAMCFWKIDRSLGFSRRGVFIGEGASSGVDRRVLTHWKLPGKIILQELVSSNFENISYVAFLKHKNSRKQGTGTVVTC
jgi:hypothetical protein